MALISDKIVYKLAIVTANTLNQYQEKLRNIKWTDGEANLDYEFSQLACKCCIDSWNMLKNGNKSKKYKNIQIECSAPDINIIFIMEDKTLIYKKIELKSSTKNIIPGSTIKNLNINQPLIFCLRPPCKDKPYQIRYSQYHQAMGTSGFETFQDRTPRPKINFNNMNCIDSNYPDYEEKIKFNWTKHYSDCAINRINNNINSSWQDELVRNIQKDTYNKFIRDTSVEQFIKLKNEANNNFNNK